MALFEKTYKKNMSSDKLGRQIWGALLKHWWLSVLVLLFATLSVISFFELSGAWCTILKTSPGNKVLYLLFLTALVSTIIIVCNNLTNINNLLRKENRITWCQIWILIAIGIWILGFIFIFEIQKDSKYYISFGLLGSVLAWVFQDKIKGAVTFIHLRLHHLLNIGDPIKIPKLDADGKIQKVTLTTMTLYNSDTTTSAIPICTLQSEHFINLHNVADGKTYGTKMQRTFLLDTSQFHPFSEEELSRYKSEEFRRYISEEELKAGVLNARLFRIYLYHWLMSHPHVSQKPRLLVRWMDQKEGGMPLQIFCLIIDNDMASFEWEQSKIIEHIITSMEWFGLRLYQSQTAYNVSDSDLHRSEKPASYRKKEEL